jgi:predicted choloylglycine hydrolase
VNIINILTFVKNVIKNIFINKAVNKRKTIKNRNKIANLSKKTNQKQNIFESGSSSANISPLTADMYAAIQSIQKNPQFREIFQGIFVK